MLNPFVAFPRDAMDYLQKIIKLLKPTIIFILVECNQMLYLVVAMWLLVSTSCVCANKPCFVCLLNVLPFRHNIFHSKFNSSELVVHISSFVYTVEFFFVMNNGGLLGHP